MAGGAAFFLPRVFPEASPPRRPAIRALAFVKRRRTRQDPNEAAGLLASTAVMAETIPPCINMIIMGFVANISIG